MKRKHKSRVTSHEPVPSAIEGSRTRAASALILTIVLTSLLAIVGVMFLMVARVNRISTSAISENKQLDYAVETAVAKISHRLALDVPGVAGAEYYDYPGSGDTWLAALEPYEKTAGNYYWRQISNVYEKLGSDLELPAEIIPDYQKPSDVGDSNSITDYPADADGDGVADSKWVELDDITSTKGLPIYAAIRIIDNGATININTAYRYPDPAIVTIGNPKWDGSKLSHVNLGGIISPTDSANGLDANTIQTVRYDTAPVPPGSDYANDTTYEYDVARRLLNPRVVNPGPPVEAYAPFDISDELEFRNRFFLFSPVLTRSGQVWPRTFNPGPGTVGKRNPYVPGDDLSAWYAKVTADPSTGTCNRRHLSTTYSFDRVIRPVVAQSSWPPAGMPAELQAAWENWRNNAGRNGAQICVNDYGRAHPAAPNKEQIAAAIWLGLPDGSILNNLPQFSGLAWTDDEVRERLACQMAVNLVDYVDLDTDVNDFCPDDVNHYYGYEHNGENLYISMIAISHYDSDITTPPSPEETHYAIELYNPGPQEISDLSNWTLDVTEDTTGTPISYPLPPLSLPADDSLILVDNSGANGFVEGTKIGNPTFQFTDNDRLELKVNLPAPLVGYRTHDVIASIAALPSYSGGVALEKYPAYRGQYIIDAGTYKFPVWPADVSWQPLVGSLTKFPDIPPLQVTAPIQMECTDSEMVTIGEFFRVLALGTMNIDGTFHTMPEFWERIRTDNGATDITDITAGHIDTANPNFGNLLRFLTVFHPFSDSVDNDGNGKSDDPANDGEDNDGDGIVDAGDPDETFANYGEYSELAVAGRININTAPWYVIAQLPWVSNPSSGNEYKLAQAIVAYRDKFKLVPNLVDYSEGRGKGMVDLTGASPLALVREEPGFANLPELINVTHDLAGVGGATYDQWYDIRRLGRDENPPGTPLNNNPAGEPPFYGSGDGVANDMLERDVIFARISNLVTVRSDVFTAYILVRIGTDGPQKRVIAIFDRSNVYSGKDKVKIVALHPVPDPR